MANAVDIAAGVSKGIETLAKIATVESDIMPYATFIAGFFPGAASVLSAIAIAQPWINKAVAAAPAIEKAINAGAPIIQAINDQGPHVMTSLKSAFAIFANADPTRPETNITAADVTDEQAIEFAGPVLLGRPWTQAETQRYWDKATGGGW